MIAAKSTTYDFERLMEGEALLKCSQFADAIIETSSEPAVTVVQLS